MLVCKHCSTSNSLDSTFCKKCGTAVPADQRREAALQLDKLIDEGLAALNASRTSEALAIASSAVASDPTHLGALHLKSAVHERRGEIADALESAERIVELNPDSELDRIKRNGLRTSLLTASTPVQPDRRVAFVAAAAAMVLVACAGVALAKGRSGGETATGSTSVASNLPTTPTDRAIIETPVMANTTPNAGLVPTNVSRIETKAVPDGTTTTITQGTVRNADLPRISGNVEPIITAQGGNLDLTPLNPGGPPTVTAPNPPKPTPPVLKPNGDPDPNPLGTEEPKNDGSIVIEVNRSGARTGGSKFVPETRTNGSAAYAQVGTERFQLGDYAGAAVNLEKAVAGGGDAVQLNLRLAQAYSRLGRTSDAASAYERSRAAATAALASGKGDKERLQAARDTADAGLKMVRGG